MWLWKRWHFLDGFYLPVYHVFVRLSSLTRNKSSVHSCILVASSLEYCALEEEYLTIAAVTVVLNWRLSLSGQIVFPVLVTMLMVLNKNPTVYSLASKVFYTSIHWQNIFIVVKEEENFDMSHHHHHHQLPCGQRRWGETLAFPFDYKIQSRCPALEISSAQLFLFCFTSSWPPLFFFGHLMNEY